MLLCDASLRMRESLHEHVLATRRNYLCIMSVRFLHCVDPLDSVSNLNKFSIVVCTSITVRGLASTAADTNQKRMLKKISCSHALLNIPYAYCLGSLIHAALYNHCTYVTIPVYVQYKSLYCSSRSVNSMWFNMACMMCGCNF